MTAEIGLFGKHPGYGDFLRANVDPAVGDHLETWLDRALSDIRDQQGQAWPTFWQQAQDLRFWIGRGVLGRSLMGVMRCSRDRGGRRYPLVLIAQGAAVPAPVRDGDQAPYAALTAHFSAMQPGQGGAALLDGLQLQLPREAEAEARIGDTLWAHQPNGDLAALLDAARGADAERALLTRSYWWSPATETRAAIWLGCAGLPSTAALHWLLAGTPLATGLPTGEEA
ncbi:type VI secretion system-associated protein TagF [Epibacterium sp. Ofav1-8]|uniref:type VI secretion system-associated protein TagF n=1 Tax=Epibacterium sp. Ofav1-8 TaxID=2917735 RepID=UPI001EF599BE|nr:type VI secretion system-associated protein TagF [Epibacterium sp. Ofav1-8]MCG7623529.1 type VI secretion system-associated protein TagF [Epibacterium sp. Ofav1-8]